MYVKNYRYLQKADVMYVCLASSASAALRPPLLNFDFTSSAGATRRRMLALPWRCATTLRAAGAVHGHMCHGHSDGLRQLLKVHSLSGDCSSPFRGRAPY